MKDIHNNQPVSCRKKFQLTDTIKNAIVYKKTYISWQPIHIYPLTVGVWSCCIIKWDPRPKGVQHKPCPHGVYFSYLTKQQQQLSSNERNNSYMPITWRLWITAAIVYSVDNDHSTPCSVKSTFVYLFSHTAPRIRTSAVAEAGRCR